MSEDLSVVIAGQLARLQKNRGLQGPNVLDKVGPELAEAVGLDSAMPYDTALDRLIMALVQAAETLPPDHRLVFKRGCALRADDAPTLKARLELVGDIIKRGPAATQRRLAAANVLVARHLIAEATIRQRGWYIGELTSAVDLREPLPVYRADRTLVVTAPALDQLTEKFAFPGSDGSPAPEYSVKGAASVDRVERLPGDIWLFTMKLDRTYHRGDHIVYHTALRMPARRFMPPMSVMAPTRECWHFSTTVHFGGLVRQAWILDGAPVAVAFSDKPSGVPIDPVATPQATAQFTTLERGSVYGLRWVWSDPASL